MDDVPPLGVLGGTGLYAMTGLEGVERKEVATPFGSPSGPVVLGRLEGRPVAFLARHGEDHRLTPSEVNYRANIYALKAVGVEQVVAISACGSLRQEIEPGRMVIPDQLFDATRGRARSFFGEGVVVHLSAPDPFCPSLSSRVAAAANAAGEPVSQGGTSITVEGPRFSTRAESRMYREWGMAIIGMTTAPEAFLAREAELCYAVLAHVTDYDVWHVEEQPVTVEMVVQQLRQNARQAEKVLRALARDYPFPRACGCASALRDAFMSGAATLSAESRQRLGLLVHHYLD
ncbi:MAG TPA: S-methyl-5'-thioadenosine phosphorylase [Anaerolineales bacterium]|nr:S-methyl-5'-thioadenosine phosphorylase [Anaerolineales bacterium]